MRTAPSRTTENRAEALVGTILSGRYRLDELIAIGGMGAVYRAEHVHMHKLHAIKVLHPTKERVFELVARFRREAIVGAHIQHPNIAAATDFGELDDGSYFLVTEFVSGKTLHARMLDGPLSGDVATRVALQVAEALAALHDKGIVHRDLKPRNLMIAEDAFATVKLIDFGLAKVDLARLPMSPSAQRDAMDAITQGGVIFGTVAYIAPEAALGMDAVDHRADLYALGVVLYEMVAGRHLFDGSPGELFMHHRKTPPPSFAERAPGVAVHPAIERVVMRLLAKEPEARYAGARELAEALDAARAEAGLDPFLPPRTALSSRPAPAASSARPGTSSSRPAPAGVPSPPRVPRAPRVPDLGSDVEVTLPRVGDSSPTVPRLPPEAPEGPGASAAPPARPEPGRRQQVAVALLLAALLLAMILVLVRGLWLRGPAEAPSSSAERSAATEAASPVAEPSPPPAPSAGPVASAAASATAPPSAAPAAPAESAAADDDAADTPTRDVGALDVDETARLLRQAAASRRWGRAGQLLEAVVDKGGAAALGAEATRVAARDAAAQLFDLGDPRGERAFAALVRAGAPGLDVLYDIVQSKGKTRAQARADMLLHERKNLAVASRELRVAIELRDAPCEKKLGMLDRAGAEGDVRTLTILETLGVGCFRKDRRLMAAIRKLKDRLGKP